MRCFATLCELILRRARTRSLSQCNGPNHSGSYSNKWDEEVDDDDYVEGRRRRGKENEEVDEDGEERGGRG